MFLPNKNENTSKITMDRLARTEQTGNNSLHKGET